MRAASAVKRLAASARSGAPTEDQPGVSIDAVGTHEERDADDEHEQDRDAGLPRCARSGRNEHRLSFVVDRLDPTEVRVDLPREAARRSDRGYSRPALTDPPNDELGLHPRENREREPERNRRLETRREQPEHDEHEGTDARGGLHTIPRAARHPTSLEAAYDPAMIDPLERWRAIGLDDKPDYAGLLTYSGLRYTHDPADLVGVDVAIVGAPMDDLTSDRPGTRFGPRAIRAAGCPPGPHLEVKLDAMEELVVVDFGDAAVLPSDPARSHAAIEHTVGQVVAAGAIPIILGGDHSITEPDVKAVVAAHGPVALVHFDTHTDTGEEVFGVEVSHGTPMYRLVRDGHVEGSRYVQIGLRGYWPGEKEFAWQAEHGITSFFMHDVRDRGIRAVVEQTIAIVGTVPDLPHRRRRRARSRVRARNGYPRAGRDDERRSALGVSGACDRTWRSSAWTSSRCCRRPWLRPTLRRSSQSGSFVRR